MLRMLLPDVYAYLIADMITYFVKLAAFSV